MKAQQLDFDRINPLISEDGNTYKVSAALIALAGLIDGLTDGEQPKDYGDDHSFGVSILLKTCAAALHHMRAD